MGGTALAERYHIFSPAKIDAKRDQNSLVLASKVCTTVVRKWSGPSVASSARRCQLIRRP